MDVLILGKETIKNVIAMQDVIDGVESAYRQKALGETAVWPLISHDFEEEHAVMDIRSGALIGDALHGLKMLNNFPLNIEKGLPPFNGILMLFDSKTGIPLGVMDASYITCMRTGAAGALGVKHLARKDSETLLLLGAGNQAMFQIAATLIAAPGIKRVLVSDPLNLEHARAFAAGAPQRLAEEFHLDTEGIRFEPVTDLPAAVGQADVIITITRAREPVIKRAWVKSGTHFSCIGADMEGKEEIDAEIFSGARIFCDDINQCITVGETEIPIQKGIISKKSIAGELGEYLTGKIQGRQNDEETTIFDATGLAILDLVTAKSALESAKTQNLGLTADLLA